MTDFQFYMHLIVSVTTIAMSGVVSAIVTYRLNKRRDERQLRRKKLEELYMAITTFKKAFDGRTVILHRWMTNHLTVDEAQSLQMEYVKKADNSRVVAGMIIAIYFHELQIDLEQFDASQNGLNGVYEQFKAAHNRVGPICGPDFLPLFEKSMDGLDTSYNRLVESIRMWAMIER